MDAITAQRRLVKSPPELWAQLSDAQELARHLGEFGEIRITRLEAERTVAWEGDRARGTVELEPSGWGTRVTLTAEAVGSEATEAGAAAEPGDGDSLSPSALELTVESTAPELPVPDPAPDPDSGPPPDPAPEPGRDSEPPRKPGLLARLFGRRRPSEPLVGASHDVVPADRPAAPDAALGPAATVAGKRGSSHDLAAKSSGPVKDDPEPMAGTPDPAEDSDPSLVHSVAAAPEAEPEKTAAILETVLNDLGTAHHRPFSRG